MNLSLILSVIAVLLIISYVFIRFEVYKSRFFDAFSTYILVYITFLPFIIVLYKLDIALLLAIVLLIEQLSIFVFIRFYLSNVNGEEFSITWLDITLIAILFFVNKFVIFPLVIGLHQRVLYEMRELLEPLFMSLSTNTGGFLLMALNGLPNNSDVILAGGRAGDVPSPEPQPQPSPEPQPQPSPEPQPQTFVFTPNPFLTDQQLRYALYKNAGRLEDIIRRHNNGELGLATAMPHNKTIYDAYFNALNARGCYLRGDSVTRHARLTELVNNITNNNR